MQIASLFVALVIAVVLAPGFATAGEPACPRGWFGIQAMVTRIDPSTGKVGKRPVGGRSADVVVNGVLCEGETLLFPKGSEKVVVELYEAGRVVIVDARQEPYTIRGGASEVLSAALAYVATAFEGALGLGLPPSRPQPTASRGKDAPEAASTRQIQAILHLRNLPRQRITDGTRPVVAWREGAGPYACQALSDGTAVLWARTDLDAGWCEFGADMQRTARLVVRDARGRSAGWNVVRAVWTEVPRPEWIALGTPVVSSADLTAWAIWIWEKAGPQWRLQSLGMLNAEASSEWLASYFLDSVLAETPLLAPRDELGGKLGKEP